MIVTKKWNNFSIYTYNWQKICHCIWFPFNKYLLVFHHRSVWQHSIMGAYSEGSSCITVGVLRSYWNIFENTNNFTANLWYVCLFCNKEIIIFVNSSIFFIILAFWKLIYVFAFAQFYRFLLLANISILKNCFLNKSTIKFKRILFFPGVDLLDVGSQNAPPL